jgi:hypothetical protein
MSGLRKKERAGGTGLGTEATPSFAMDGLAILTILSDVSYTTDEPDGEERFASGETCRTGTVVNHDVRRSA